MIRCEVCGTDNDAKLTFCSNCGHRLKPKQREVPPTPATAMRKAQLPQTSPGLANAEEEEEDWGPDAARSRPSAPVLALGGEGEGEGDDGKIGCSQCGATSPRGYRFCITCGAGLKARPAAARTGGSTRSPGEEARAAKKKKKKKSGKDRPSQAEAPPEAAPAPSVEELIHCPQCGTPARRSDRFCKSCGHNLADELQAGTDDEPFPLQGAEAASVEAAPAEAPPEPDQAPEPTARRDAQRRGAFDVSGDAPAEVSGRLVVIVEDGSEGRTLELRGRQVDIGSRDGDIVLSEDRYLSPRHARFFRQDDRWYLRDLDSVNGVYRRLRTPVALRDGDLVLLGLEVLQFQLVDHGERGLGHAIQHSVLVFGSPAATRRARLCQRTVEGVIRDVYHLVSDETTVGRETGDIVFTSDPFMSRRHAAIQWDDGAQEYVLTDLNSSNGTYLAIRQDVQLMDGDYIRLGQHLFRVDLP